MVNSDDLLLHQLHDETRIKVEGSDVMLGAKASNLLGPAVHELASHAITCRQADEDRLHLTVSWDVERG